ncbi:epoxide hydrolase family protein [Modestobacter lapidis]|nr:epoxide hydrolase [Modestobacter lapidis]
MHEQTAADAVQPFRVDVPQAEVDDLADRLTRTRWPAPAPADAEDGSRGLPAAVLRELVEHWCTGWDWRAQEAALNAWPQVTTTVDGTRLHALHVRSPEPDAVPLVLVHGWPGSIVEFARVLGPLTDPRAHGGDPADAVHLVVPSLPGYGFSGPPPDTGWTTARMARAVAELVRRLGYDRYAAHGGDWGSQVVRDLAVCDAAHLLGVHVTMTMGLAAGQPTTEDERRAAERAARFRRDLAGYNLLQSTRPLSIAAALTDSPVGQLAWIAERFAEWTDPASVVDRDLLLTDVAVYWFTRTAGSSAQVYWETRHAGPGEWSREVPTGVAVFPYELIPPTRAVVARTVDLVHWTEFDRGGHFPAIEVPDLLVGDLRAFLRRAR